MARPQRNDVDYFPHAVTHGKKMFYLRDKYGNDGYAVWFILLEQLGKANYHYLHLEDAISIKYLCVDMKVEESTLLAIINELVLLDEIDRELWEKCKVIFIEKFAESVSDAYSKRSNSQIDKNSLRVLLHDKGILKLVKSTPKLSKSILNSTVKSQSKVKDSKVKDSKEESFERFWNLYDKKTGVKKVKEKFLKLDDEIIKKIFKALPKYLQSKSVKDGYKKNPLTWINGEHWNDEILDKKPRGIDYSKIINQNVI